MSTALLNGTRCTSAEVHIPAHGAWWASASLDTEATLSGQVTLTIADLTLIGTVVSGGPSKGRSHYRIVGGKGGWSSVVPAVHYSNDAGVKYSKVLDDLARAAGETLTDIPTGTVGTAWTRPADPASRVLELLFPKQWYVDETGVTHIGARSSAPLATKATIVTTDPARGTVVLAADSIATILPGVVVEGFTAVDVLHEVSSDGLRSTIWGEGRSAGSRRLAALKALVLGFVPDLKFRGVYEYRVVQQGFGDGGPGRCDLQSVRVSLGMPDLRRVLTRPGVAGANALLALGSRVLVAFVNADPARPVIVGFEDPESNGFVPDTLNLCDAGGRVLRAGDKIKIAGVNPGAGVDEVLINFATSIVTEGDPGTGYSRVKA